MIITSELLGRFLRAKGIAWTEGWSARDMLASLTTEAVASLGVCAMSDHLLHEAADIEHQMRTGAGVLGDGYVVKMLRAQARSMLKRAGVDPARWIELAERGNAQGTGGTTRGVEPSAHAALVPTPPATEQASDRDGDALRALMPFVGAAESTHQSVDRARDVLRNHAPCGRCAGRGDLCEPECAQPCGARETCDLCSGLGFTPASVEAAIARAEEQERLDAKIFDDARMLADRRARGLTDQDEHAIRARLSAALDRRTHLSAHVAPDRGDP